MSDPLYDACLALKGGTTWWTTDQIAEGLRARGADFIIKKDISTWQARRDPRPIRPEAREAHALRALV